MHIPTQITTEAIYGRHRIEVGISSGSDIVTK